MLSLSRFHSPQARDNRHINDTSILLSEGPVQKPHGLASQAVQSRIIASRIGSRAGVPRSCSSIRISAPVQRPPPAAVPALWSLAWGAAHSVKRRLCRREGAAPLSLDCAPVEKCCPAGTPFGCGISMCRRKAGELSVGMASLRVGTAGSIAHLAQQPASWCSTRGQGISAIWRTMNHREQVLLLVAAQ